MLFKAFFTDYLLMAILFTTIKLASTHLMLVFKYHLIYYRVIES